MLSANSKSVENLKPLTSLRFFAALMIVSWHSVMFYPWFAGAPSYLTHGVSFFFVLSGFILTHVYISKKQSGYFGFVRDRIARLWPVHVFALCVLVVFVRADSVTFDGQGLFSKPVQLGLNLTLMHSIFPFEKIMFSWNSVSWSISTEFFFYLAFPFLVIGIRNNWLIKLLLTTLVSAIFVFSMTVFSKTQSGQDIGINMFYAAYSNPLFRGVEFVLGMSLWVVWDRYVRSYQATYLFWSAVEIVAVLFAVWWVCYGIAHAITYLDNFESARLMVSTMGSCWVFAILIGVVASGRGIVGSVLSNRVLVYLGEISFSSYMIHLVLLKVFAFSLAGYIQTTPLMYFSALLFLASVSYWMIEKPAQRLLRSKKKAASKDDSIPAASFQNVN
ncbi:acyltransferase family protein [Pseudomonas koreensis]|uniref:Acyltransferase n=1 Tax=Pseudomonas koreensis TaxID=198620 RepID=A0A9X3BAW9_9PSED|nr:acyltransferase [Pseudomonas koreensis]MCU7247835.1 acyltransferase [Pseudomonas koreensis]